MRPFFANPIFTAVERRPDAADVVLLFLVDAHHHRRVRLLREQRRDGLGDRTGDLAAEAAARVSLRMTTSLGSMPTQRATAGTVCAVLCVEQCMASLPVFPVRHRRSAFERQVGVGGGGEGLVEHERGFLEAGVDVSAYDH